MNEIAILSRQFNCGKVSILIVFAHCRKSTKQITGFSESKLVNKLCTAVEVLFVNVWGRSDRYTLLTSQHP